MNLGIPGPLILVRINASDSNEGFGIFFFSTFIATNSLSIIFLPKYTFLKSICEIFVLLYIF